MDEFDTVVSEAPVEFGAEEAEKPEKGFPSCFYGPDGQSAVFSRSKDVPSGWHDHPSQVKGAPDPSLDVSEKRPERSLIVKRLNQLKVPFNAAAKASDLHALLLASEKPVEPLPEPAKAKAAASPLSALRKRYKELTGKLPSPRATAEKLEEAIKAAEAKK